VCELMAQQAYEQVRYNRDITMLLLELFTKWTTLNLDGKPTEDGIETLICDGTSSDNAGGEDGVRDTVVALTTPKQDSSTENKKKLIYIYDDNTNDNIDESKNLTRMRVVPPLGEEP